MENREIVEHIVHGMEYYMETLALPSHMEKYSDGMCSWIKPKDGAMGPEAVYRVNFGDNSDEQIRQILQSYRNQGLPDYWCITPLSAPNHIRDILVSLKILEANAENNPGMALFPDEYRGNRDCDKPASTITVRIVNNKSDFRIWTDIANEVLHGCRLLDPDQYYTLCESGKMGCFLGYRGEVPVSTSATINNNGSATLEFVATLPNYRKQGFAAAVCHAAIEQLIRENAYVITLRAREMGVSIYKKLGFKVYY
jgi:GNAT superfamily N-acetyltransferase